MEETSLAELELTFDESYVLRMVLKAKLDQLHGESFEEFIDELMELTDPTYINVRTHGSLGDMGSDGLSSKGDRLYACYAPEKPTSAGIIKKFKNDLESAKRQRSGTFDEFMFVHNDTRGTHPEIAGEIAKVGKNNPKIQISLCGFTKIFDKTRKLSKPQVELLLGRPLPLSHDIEVVGDEDLFGILDHLKESADSAILEIHNEIAKVSEEKLNYNRLDDISRHEIIRGLGRISLVEQYYSETGSYEELDRVSQTVRDTYEGLRSDKMSPLEIIDQMRVFIGGNRKSTVKAQFAENIVLAFFFERCKIFDEVPSGWKPPDSFTLAETEG